MDPHKSAGKKADQLVVWREGLAWCWGMGQPRGRWDARVGEEGEMLVIMRTGLIRVVIGC